MQNPNPMTGGMRAVMRDPSIFVVEIVWRWCFGITAFFLLFFTGLMFLRTVQISDAEIRAFQSRDAMLISLAGARLLSDAGGKLLIMAVLALPSITCLWVAFSAIGRTLTLKRMIEDQRVVRFRSVLALQCWRAFFAWVTIAAVLAAIVFAGWLANRGSSPDYVTYYVVAGFLTITAAVFWSIVNWYLSLAALWIGKQGAGAYMSVRLAMGFASAHRGDTAGLSLIFALIRLLAIAILFILCALPVGLAKSAPNGYLAWVVVVSLAYIAVADFLYISRLASYLLLEDSSGEPMVVPEPPPSEPLPTDPATAAPESADILELNNGFSSNGH